MPLTPKHSIRKHKALREFTDREDQTERFRALLRNKDPKKHHVLMFYGVGGVGKTSLQEELKEIHTRECSFPVSASLDFESAAQREAGTALYSLSVSLRTEHKVGFPAFNLAYAIYHKKEYPNVPLTEKVIPGLEEVGDMAGILSALGDLPVVGMVPNISKFLFKGVDYLRQKYHHRKFDLNILGEMKGHEIVRYLPQFFAEDLNAYLSETDKGRVATPVIFLDTYEAIWKDRRSGAMDFERDEWVRELVTNLPRVLWVICGREKIDWAEGDREWNDVLDQHLVGDLSEADARKFLRACGILDDSVQSAIYGGARGLPYYLDLCVETFERVREIEGRIPVAEDFGGTHREVHDRFLRYLDRKEHATLEIMSIPRFWDRKLMEALVGEFQTGYPMTQFTQGIGRFSFIQESSPGLWRMHAVMREGMEERMDQEYHQRAHDYLFKYFGEQLEHIRAKELRDQHVVAFQEAFHHGRKETVEEVKAFWDWYSGLREVFAGACKHTVVIPLDESILSILEKVYGPDHAYIANTLNGLGNLCRDLGRHKEAGKYYQCSLETFEKVWGPEHADVAIALNGLGALCFDLGRYEEAEKYFLRSLDIKEKVLRPDHTDVAKTLNNLGCVCWSLGRHEEAEEYILRSLMVFEKVGVPANLLVAATLNNLGEMCVELGRHQEAERYLLRSLSLKEEVSGPEHSDLAKALNNLGNLYRALGRHEEAERYYLRSLDIFEKFWGPEHAEVAHTRNNLGNLYRALGRHEEAERYHLRSLAILEKFWGPVHASVADTMNNLGNLCRDLGRYGDAEKYYLQALGVRKKVEGPSIKVADLLESLSGILKKLGREEEASQIHLSAEEIRSRLQISSV